MNDKNKKQTTEKPEKLPKPVEKLIWFGASVVIAAVGFALRKSGVELHWVVKALYSALQLFAIIMAAQKTSIERFDAAPNEETGDKGNRKKYIISTLIYYLFIFVAVFFVFYCMWVCKVLSV